MTFDKVSSSQKFVAHIAESFNPKTRVTMKLDLTPKAGAITLGLGYNQLQGISGPSKSYGLEMDLSKSDAERLLMVLQHMLGNFQYY